MPLAAKKSQPQKQYRPLLLKGVLTQYGIPHHELAGSVRQTHGFAAGRPLCLTVVRDVLNWDVWPTLTPRDHLKDQVEALLRARGVTASVIATIWEVDETDLYKGKHPAGCHKLKPEPDDYAARVGLKEVPMMSAAAKRNFHVFKDPFSADDVGCSEDLFMTDDHRRVLDAMFRVARQGGFLAVIGESGSGKSTLRRELLAHMARDGAPVTVIQPRVVDKSRLTAGMICQAIIRDMSTQRPRQSLEEKARQVEELLMGSSRAGNSNLLLIEEAHDLPLATLKYLKRFWEFEDGLKKLLGIILVGQTELRAKLDERQNYGAREVIRRCEIAELPPLDDHLEEYVAFKLARIGKDARQFIDPSAYGAMRQRLTIQQRHGAGELSICVPLLVNVLLVRALNLAAAIGARKIDADVIKEA